MGCRETLVSRKPCVGSGSAAGMRAGMLERTRVGKSAPGPTPSPILPHFPPPRVSSATAGGEFPPTPAGASKEKSEAGVIHGELGLMSHGLSSSREAWSPLC